MQKGLVVEVSLAGNLEVYQKAAACTSGTCTGCDLQAVLCCRCATGDGALGNGHWTRLDDFWHVPVLCTPALTGWQLLTDLHKRHVARSHAAQLRRAPMPDWHAWHHAWHAAPCTAKCMHPMHGVGYCGDTAFPRAHLLEASIKSFYRRHILLPVVINGVRAYPQRQLVSIKRRHFTRQRVREQA